MKTMTREDFDTAAIAMEPIDGDGAILLNGVFDKDLIACAREPIVAETDLDRETGSHFDQSGTNARLRRRVWFTRLVALSPDIARLLEDPMIFETVQAFLGDEFIVGSMSAPRTMLGFGGREPHIHYPYWDFHRARTFPMRTNASFPLNGQAVIVVDPFTEENRATALAPGSRKALRYPTKEDKFHERCIRLAGEPGDVALFFGAAWHGATPNKSDGGRIGILVGFLPKFVKPIEDLLTGLDEDFQKSASPVTRQLLGFDHPWPSTPPHSPMQ